jgi:hypothetical protein
MRAAVAVLWFAVPACVFAQGNPAERPSRDITALTGSWNGSHLEQRQGCLSAPNNGFHGTYSSYSISVVGSTITVNETGLTGLSCTWNGDYRDEGGRTVISGTHACTDGRSGPFEAQGFFVLSTLMSLRLSVQLTGSESCTIDAILEGARF